MPSVPGLEKKRICCIPITAGPSQSEGLALCPATSVSDTCSVAPKLRVRLILGTQGLTI